MSELRKVHDSPREIRYAHPHLGGWIVAAIGVAGVAASWIYVEGTARWGGLALAAIFLAGGASAALARFELTFDLDQGRFRFRRGTVFNAERGEESLDAVEAVVLKKEVERRGTREVVDEWEVELKVRGWELPVEVFESKEEAAARSEAEGLARRLSVPLEERTGR